jgi:serpin B
MAMTASMPQELQPPIEVRVDRPFLFAIQHIPSGTCLFLGRLTDPR